MLRVMVYEEGYQKRARDDPKSSKEEKQAAARRRDFAQSGIRLIESLSMAYGMNEEGLILTRARIAASLGAGYVKGILFDLNAHERALRGG